MTLYPRIRRDPLIFVTDHSAAAESEGCGERSHGVTLTLSVLDLVPVRTGQTSADAVQASLALARTADDVGYHRYWVAEHHNMPAVAATNPPVLIAMLGAATSRIRVGSGGVMLPNHAPMVVAEQFGLLEAAYPGRVDLGIGRAPGSDPVTNWALRHGTDNDQQEAVARFPQYVDDVIAMLSPEGVGLNLRGTTYELRATPAATSEPRVWLLGSSDYSAQLAAAKGLPYVFAHHFSGSGTAEALALYRQGFTPSEEAATPTTFLTANVAVAESADEAERLALPQLQAMAALRSGAPLTAQRTVEEAEAVGVPPQQEGLIEAMKQRWLVGDPDQVAARLHDLAATYDVDEVMIHPVTAAYAADDPATSPSREETLRLLAKAIS